MRTQVTLRSDDAERFKQIRSDLQDQLGYAPSNAETLRLLMAGFDPDAVIDSE